MIWIAFGRWNHSAGRWFVRRRLYWQGYRWTPFVRIKGRYKQIDTERADWKRWCLDAERALAEIAKETAPITNTHNQRMDGLLDSRRQKKNENI